MPTYEYRCRQCDTTLEVVQAFSDAALTECPSCGGELRKVFGNVGISFKGSGFYKNDSRAGASKRNGSHASSAEGSSSNGDSSTSGDSTSKDSSSKDSSSKDSSKSSSSKESSPKSSPSNGSSGTKTASSGAANT